MKKMSDDTRKIYTKVVFDMATGDVVDEDYYFYTGPVALCDGSDNSDDDTDLDNDDNKNLDDDNKDDKVDRKELEKAIAVRDRIKQEKRQLQDKLKEIQSQMEGMVSSSDLDELKTQLNELSEYKKQIEEEKELKDLESKTELERKEVLWNKELEKTRKDLQSKLDEQTRLIEEFKQKTSKKEEKIKELRSVQLENKIQRAAIKYGAVSPSQIVKLTLSDFDYVDDEDKFVYRAYKNGKLKDELEVDDYIKSFLEDEDNDNLVKVELRQGFNNTQTNSNQKVSSTGKRYGYDPKDPEIIEKAFMANFKDVNDYIDTQIVKDKALGKLKEK